MEQLLEGPSGEGSAALVAFLRARLDEDEQAARDAHYEGQRWISEEETVYRWPDDEAVHSADRKRDAAHIVRWQPARVLAEVEAKRRIVERYRDERARRDAYQADDARAVEDTEQASRRRSSAARCRGLEIAVELLARPYADHPDFRQEWMA